MGPNFLSKCDDVCCERTRQGEGREGSKSWANCENQTRMQVVGHEQIKIQNEKKKNQPARCRFSVVPCDPTTRQSEPAQLTNIRGVANSRKPCQTEAHAMLRERNMNGSSVCILASPRSHLCSLKNKSKSSSTYSGTARIPQYPIVGAAASAGGISFHLFP